MKNYLPLIAAMALVCSCSTTKMTVRSARTTDLPAEVSLSPTTADLNISETKSEGVCKQNQNGIFLSMRDMEREAVADALAKTKADILVNPNYTYVYEDNKLSEVSVSGYPAKYANFRSTTEQDAEILYKLREPAAVVIKTEVEKK